MKILRLDCELWLSRITKLLGIPLIILATVLISMAGYLYFILHQNILVRLLGVYILANIFFHYSMCIFMDPGTPEVPLPEQNDINNDTDTHILITPSTKTRICGKCGLTKPERAHHCSICNRCVMKMDHHWYWLI